MTSPIGSQRKRAAISGTQMIQTVSKNMTFAKGRPGEAQLVCTKDRHGNYVTGETALRLTVNPEPSRGLSGVNVQLIKGAAESFLPTRHMSDICDLLKKTDAPLNTSSIKRSITGKAETIGSALDLLVYNHYLTVTDGPKGSKVYELLKPFNVGDDISLPDAEPECDHEWHDGKTCDSDWCHPTHFGECNKTSYRSEHEGLAEDFKVPDVEPAYQG